MPCYTSRVTMVELDAAGLDFDRLVEAGRAVGVRVNRVRGQVQLRDSQQRDAAEVTRLVKQSYAKLTVQAGLKKFGFKTKSTTTVQQASVGAVTRLRVGR